MIAAFRLAAGCAGLALVATLLACGDDDRGAQRSASTPSTTRAGRIVTAVPPASQQAVRVAAGSGISVLPSAGEAAGATVDVTGMRYQPELIRIKAGQSVTWTFNDGDIPHTVTAFDQSFDSGVLRQGSLTLRFDRPGEYCYQCALHPGRNTCSSAAIPESRLGGSLVAEPHAGGGGHMQGKVIVE
jgi:plastocyanin